MHGQRFADMPFGPGFGRGRGRGPGGRGRGPEAPPPVERSEVAGWFAGRLPDGWFTGPVELTVDRDEITVVGTLAEPEAGEGDAAAARAAPAAAHAGEGRVGETVVVSVHDGLLER